MGSYNNKKIIVGYTAGVFDLFHIGHLNILRNAKGMCDELIVGVSSDELVSYKGKQPVIPYEERSEIVRNIKCVDAVVKQDNMDKFKMWEKLQFDIMFVGDDWKGTDKWNKLEEQFSGVGVKIVYFPYTKTTSSTLITETLHSLNHVNK